MAKEADSERLERVKEIGLGLVASAKGVKEAVRTYLPAIEEILAAGGGYREVLAAMEQAGALPSGADRDTVKKYVQLLRKERRRSAQD